MSEYTSPGGASDDWFNSTNAFGFPNESQLQYDLADPNWAEGAASEVFAGSTGYTAPPDQPAQGTGSGVYGAGIPAALASGANTLTGGISGAITTQGTNLVNTLKDAVGQAQQLSANWALRGAFFLLGIILLVVGLISAMKAGTGIAHKQFETPL